jgi:cell wall-associated NlpC family hydrolase
MSLEVFVRAVGAAMGVARDSFGAAATGQTLPAASAAAAPQIATPGTGQALGAFETESSRLTTHATTLAEQDASTHAQLSHAVAAATAGRARMEGIIGAASASVQALAPATATPQGQQALVTALTAHLHSSQQALQDGLTDASTRAASSQTTAADYHAVGSLLSNQPASGLTSQEGLMGAAPLAGLGSLGSLTGMAPDALGAGSGSQRTRSSGLAAPGGNVDTVVSRALSQRGTPYAWGGGGKSGPGRGDDGVVGFDCSSLMQYAFAGAGVDLPRTTYDQIRLGRTVAPSDIQAGDLVFSEFGEGGAAGPGHVQLAISPNHVVEAPHTGANVRVSAVPSGHVVVKRIW